MSRIARLIALILIVAALLLLALLAVPEVSGLAQRPAWRVALNRYLAFKATPGSAPITMVVASHATLPWQFGRDLSAGTFGDSVFFATDYRYTGEAGGSRPVPFPPADVWCVLLDEDQASSGSATRRVAFVALHEDLYNADWLVHEGMAGPITPQLAGDLAGIGCAFPADR